MAEDPLMRQALGAEIEITQDFSHHHVQFGQHRTRDQGSGTRAQVEKPFRRTDQFHAVASVELFQLVLKIH
ncbi:hypothetical protein D3C79_981050 [compost metagenome]